MEIRKEKEIMSYKSHTRALLFHLVETYIVLLNTMVEQKSTYGASDTFYYLKIVFLLDLINK